MLNISLLAGAIGNVNNNAIGHNHSLRLEDVCKLQGFKVDFAPWLYHSKSVHSN